MPVFELAEHSTNEGGPRKPEDSVPATQTRPLSASPASERTEGSTLLRSGDPRVYNCQSH